MILLETKELNSIHGGFGWSIIVGLGALITFVIGVVDGYVRPLKCR